jgi:hypothetical protein
MNLCRHWIGSDATGRRCTASADRSGFCEKHYAVELRRAAQARAKRVASEARAEAAWFDRNAHRVPAWRRQLEQAESEYARRTAAPVGDRAAVGGDMHGSIVQAQRSHLSDTNVARVAELDRIIERLRENIARAERVA